MKNALNNLKLLTKLNITLLLSMFTIIISALIFYFITDIFLHTIEENTDSKNRVQNASRDIIKMLHKIDYITIDSAINATHKHKAENLQLYKQISQHLLAIDTSKYLNNKEAHKILQKIKVRLKGYKLIANSLAQEVRESSTDGLYAIMALSSASQIIMQELQTLNKKTNAISQEKITKLNQNLFYIKIFSLCFVFILFLFLAYINKLIVSSILTRVETLKEGVISFFDLLSKKREDIIYIEQDGNDEISEITQIIDDHLHIATDILEAERADTELIEKKVNEATQEIRNLNNEIEATQREVVFTMGSIAEERSKETGNHVKRVAEYSLILARLYGLSLKESLLIKNASPMHDIGKIAIPDAILNKPGRFSPEEFEIMKEHAEMGYKMLKHSNRSILKAASILAYEHHERWDGKGYPQGLQGEEIHIYGRITAIADVFDALGSERVYKKAWPLKKILTLFEEEKGKQFDPKLVKLFLDNLEHFLAAKEMIESEYEDSTLLSSYIEDFNRVPNYIKD